MNYFFFLLNKNLFSNKKLQSKNINSPLASLLSSILKKVNKI